MTAITMGAVVTVVVVVSMEEWATWAEAWVSDSVAM